MSIRDEIGNNLSWEGFYGDAVVLDGEYTLEDLKKLVAHIEKYGYKDADDADRK